MSTGADTENKIKGMEDGSVDCFIGRLRAARFIWLFRREPFDYTK